MWIKSPQVHSSAKVKLSIPPFNSSISIPPGMLLFFYFTEKSLRSVWIAKLYDMNKITLTEQHIIQVGSSWQIQSDTGENLGIYATKAEAESRLKQLRSELHERNINKDVSIIYSAVKKLNQNNGCELVCWEVKNISTDKWTIILSDENMKRKMETMKKQGFTFIDYISEFNVEIAKQFFISNVLEPYDNAVGITKNIDKETKILLRIAFRIWVKWKDWRGNIVKNHPELK